MSRTTARARRPRHPYADGMPVLGTKVHVPRLHGRLVVHVPRLHGRLVARLRLIERLDGALGPACGSSSSPPPGRVRQDDAAHGLARSPRISGRPEPPAPTKQARGSLGCRWTPAMPTPPVPDPPRRGRPVRRPIAGAGDRCRGAGSAGCRQRRRHRDRPRQPRHDIGVELLGWRCVALRSPGEGQTGAAQSMKRWPTTTASRRGRSDHEPPR